MLVLAAIGLAIWLLFGKKPKPLYLRVDDQPKVTRKWKRK